MSNICLIVLGGLPGSGKSTLAQELREECDKMTMITVEYDMLFPADVEKSVIELEAEENSLWKKYRSEIVTCVDFLIQTIQNTRAPWAQNIDLPKDVEHVRDDLWNRFVSTVKDSVCKTRVKESSCDTVGIVIDDNMYYRSMRHPYFQLARKYTISFCEVFLDVDPDLALERNQGREVKVKDDVIVAMATKMELPEPDKEPWEKFSMVMNSGIKYNCVSVVSLIKEALSEPVQPIQEVDPEQRNQSRVVCSENLVHQSDQILRKIVSECMESAKGQQLSKHEMKEMASTVQAKRKQILELLKTGELLVPSSLVAMATDSSKSSDSELFKFLKNTFEHL